MKVTFYLENPTGTKRNPEGNLTAIFARIRYGGYQLKYYTPEKILPKFWNGKPITKNGETKYNMQPHRAKVTAKFPEQPEFNRRLDTIETDIKNVIRKYANDNENNYPAPAVLKPLLDIAIRRGGKVDKITFMSYFADYIAQCRAGVIAHAKTGKQLARNTIVNYETTLTNIRRYIADTRNNVDFENIDLDFYTSFNEYCATYENKENGKEKQSLNTIGKHTKIIKTILNYATEKGVNKNLAFKSRKFVTISEDTDTIYLTDSELKLIADLDLSENKKLDVIRDLFLIGCNTGLRISDLSTLRPEQINKGMINITRQIKTGQPVKIPVSDTVTNIMAKYGGKLPTARSSQKTNEYIKDVCKQIKALRSLVSVSGTKGGVMVTRTLPKWQLVATHTMRRSFATNEYLAGTPSLTIMAMTGHKTEKAFMKYIRVTPDQHAKILQGIWDERKIKQPKTIAI